MNYLNLVPIFRSMMSLGAALLLSMLLSACSVNIGGDDIEIADEGDLEDLQAREYDFTGFTNIEIDSSAQLIFTQADDYSVILLTEEDHFDNLILELDGDTLVLDHDGRHRGERHVRLEIRAPNLESVEVDGALDGRFENLSLDALTIEVSGAINLEMEGTCNQVEFYIHGAGNIEARGFECKNVLIEMAGAGHAELYASGEIEIEITGVGHVEVWGGPIVRRQEIFGIGSVDIKGQ